ncbi:variable surface protein [Plasmodium gonderi]|uniref:Variable surface protein n=1 Tax=Plasmodium gonderi TaxID=77519 RepID=A0A1Y1JAX6_PLAGO|nr:variable surface protein [Plasmodium gonderi]GAW79410.1 variable surface protein [Plasmodium gonderi]
MMSEENIVDYAFNLLSKNVKFFEKSELYKFYDIIDLSYEGHKSTIKCNVIRDNNAIQICGYLEEIASSWNDKIVPIFCSKGINNFKCCDFLFYWLYGKFVKYNIKSSDINSIFDKFKTLFETQCYSANKERFYIKRVYDKKVLKEKKELHDFVEYYSTIKDLWNDEENEHKNYCLYMKHILQLYKKLKEKKCSTLYKCEMEMLETKIIDDLTEFNFLKRQCSDISSDLDIIKKTKIKCPQEPRIYNEQPQNGVQQNIHTTNIGESAAAQKRERFKTASSEKLLHKMNKIEDVLSPFSSYEIYDEFNNENNLSNHRICETIGNNEMKDLKLNTFCKQIVKNLKNIYGILNRERRDECCLYFNYWLHDQHKKKLDTILEKDKKTAYTSKLLEMQFPIINELGIHDCYYDFKNNLDYWEEIIYLLYYFKSYESTLSNIYPEKDKHEEYCNYLSKIKKLFEKYIKHCCTCYTIPREYCENHCSGYFKCEKQYYPINLISKLQCNHETATESAEQLFKSVTIDQKVNLLSLKSNGFTNTDNYNNKPSMLIYNNVRFDPFNLIAIGGLTFIGISLLFFIFYKFTPFGSRLNRKSMKKKINYGVYQKNISQRLGKDSGPRNANSRNKRIHITYRAQ